MVETLLYPTLLKNIQKHVVFLEKKTLEAPHGGLTQLLRFLRQLCGLQRQGRSAQRKTPNELRCTGPSMVFRSFLNPITWSHPQMDPSFRTPGCRPLSLPKPTSCWVLPVAQLPKKVLLPPCFDGGAAEPHGFFSLWSELVRACGLWVFFFLTHSLVNSWTHLVSKRFGPTHSGFHNKNGPRNVAAGD